jgi:transcriptional regulator with XRE-family HTH domain
VAQKIRTPRQAFGEVLRIRRTATGLSQEAFAQVCGLHRTYVSQLERSLKSPTIDTLIMIATALEVPAHQLVKAVEERLAAKKSRLR